MAKTSASPAGTTSNQFFIVAGPQGESLPPQYALFGQVTSGLSVVQAINADGSERHPADCHPPHALGHRLRPLRRRPTGPHPIPNRPTEE